MSLKIKALVSLLALSATSFYAHSAKPMTENDLGEVSAVTGDHILNMFGAPAAGLTIDQAETISSNEEIAATNKKETYKEGNTTEVFANAEIKSLESESSEQPLSSPSIDVDISVFEEAIYASKQTIGVATTLNSSNSEIQYFDKNMHHELTVLSNNNVKITRDLHIDLLKIDKLNTTADGPSAGSIYLSDWRSRGSAHMVPSE